VGYVTSITETRNANTNFWSKNLKGRDLLEDIGMDEHIWIELIWPRIWSSGWVF
jgi:hypothetical protein